jgi:hypothetical protein
LEAATGASRDSGATPGNRSATAMSGRGWRACEFSGAGAGERGLVREAKRRWVWVVAARRGSGMRGTGRFI